MFILVPVLSVYSKHWYHNWIIYQHTHCLAPLCHNDTRPYKIKEIRFHVQQLKNEFWLNSFSKTHLYHNFCLAKMWKKMTSLPKIKFECTFYALNEHKMSINEVQTAILKTIKNKILPKMFWSSKKNKIKIQILCLFLTRPSL